MDLRFTWRKFNLKIHSQIPQIAIGRTTITRVERLRLVLLLAPAFLASTHPTWFVDITLQRRLCIQRLKLYLIPCYFRNSKSFDLDKRRRRNLFSFSLPLSPSLIHVFSHCGSHFIALYEGLTPSSDRLATVCGQDKKGWAFLTWDEFFVD